mgnify:CR=1 FL=1
MKNKKIWLIVMLSSLFLVTGCGKENTTNNGTKALSYTNKFECTRTETYTTSQVYYLTKQETLNEEDNGKTAMETTIARSYDFNKSGSELLAYYEITTYNFLVNYDMEAIKEIFEETCKSKDKDTYKNCNVSLKDKTITVVSEVNLNSDASKEYLSSVTLDSIKENYAESPYTCK